MQNGMYINLDEKYVCKLNILYNFYLHFYYIFRSPTQTAADSDTQRMVEGKWQGFIAENLLFYTLLFYHLMCRLFRLDLSAPKNAHILFRVTKVVLFILLFVLV